MTTEVASVIFTILYSIVLILESMAIGYDIKDYKRKGKYIKFIDTWYDKIKENFKKENTMCGGNYYLKLDIREIEEKQND